MSDTPPPPYSPSEGRRRVIAIWSGNQEVPARPTPPEAGFQQLHISEHREVRIIPPQNRGRGRRGRLAERPASPCRRFAPSPSPDERPAARSRRQSPDSPARPVADIAPHRVYPVRRLPGAPRRTPPATPSPSASTPSTSHSSPPPPYEFQLLPPQPVAAPSRGPSRSSLRRPTITQYGRFRRNYLRPTALHLQQIAAIASRLRPLVLEAERDPAQEEAVYGTVLRVWCDLLQENESLLDDCPF
jgi:hypothetical protein